MIIVLRESKTLTGGAEGMHVPPPLILGFSFARMQHFLLLCAALYALTIIPMAILLAGPFGKNLRALASNENAARAFGIDVRHHLIAAFTFELGPDRICGRGLCAALSHHRPGQLSAFSPRSSLSPIRLSAAWGRSGADLLGGGILRVIPELLRPLADYIELIFCVLVVATLTLFPDGLASAFWRATERRSDAKPGASFATPEIELPA